MQLQKAMTSHSEVLRQANVNELISFIITIITQRLQRALCAVGTQCKLFTHRVWRFLCLSVGTTECCALASDFLMPLQLACMTLSSVSLNAHAADAAASVSCMR